MSWGSITRIQILAVNWIIRRIGVGVALFAMIVAVLAIVAGFYLARHGSPMASGIIWVKE